MTGNISARIADYVAGATWQGLPDAVRHEARRALVNHFAAALFGCRDPAIDTLVAVLGPLSGPAQARLIGRNERLDLANAASINAAASNVLDFCDTHMPTVIHPTAPIAPALLALAETRPITGAALLTALAVGIDVACRIGNAISPEHYDDGWHITGTCGVLGAAVAAGKLVGLDRDGLVSALGCGATQAAGLVETLGHDAKSLNVANAARGGLVSALLAERGFGGPRQPLEGKRGFLAVLGRNVKMAAITDGLGQRSEIANLTYKPYPCGVVLHPVIDACLELRVRPGFDVASVERVVVRGAPLLKARADRQVTTGREAQVCLGHTVAVALLLGRAGVAEYTDQCVNDPAVRALSSRVDIEVDEAIAVESAEVIAAMRGGGGEMAVVAHCRGSLGRPMSDAELEAKLEAAAAMVLAPSAVQRLLQALWSLDTLEDAASPLRLAARA